MRHAIKWIIASIFALPISAAVSGVAHARPPVTILQCIGNYNQCWMNCINNPLPPVNGSYQNCLNRCDDNHSYCVSLAFSNPALNPPPPPRKPRPKTLTSKSQ